MQTMHSGTKQVISGRAPHSLLFSSRWNTLASQLVHAPKKSPQSGSAGLGGGLYTSSPQSGSSALGGGLYIGSSGLSLSGLTPATPKAPVPNLWVENGAIWQLPNLLVGFTSYSAASTFFGSVKGLGYEAAPSSWYEGSPFSATDFPILHWGKKGVEINGFLLVWPSLTAIAFASTFLPMLPVSQPLIPSPAPSAGPVAPVSSMGSFSANSPSGVQTFRAQYIMYGPWGPSPLSGTSTSGTGIKYDMILYSWWYNF